MKGLRGVDQAECVPWCEFKFLAPKSNSSKSNPLAHDLQRYPYQETQRKAGVGWGRG